VPFRLVGLDLDLTVSLDGDVVSPPVGADVLVAPAQQLAHLTVNGAALRTGDMSASGTVSGPRPRQCGSFFELSCTGPSR